MRLKHLVGLCAVLSAPLSAQTIDPAFASDYNFIDLGTPAGVPGPLGGIHFKPGDSNTLWLGGSANNGLGEIFEVPVTRDGSGHIVSFGGAGVASMTAPNIDGGIAFSSDGVVFVTTYSNNHLLQFLPGSTTPDLDINLNTLGVASSVGTCQFVPAGFPGAGKFKLASYNASQWYDVDLVQNAAGTYDIAAVTATVNPGGGPEGIVYISGGNPGFSIDSVLVSEYSAGAVRAYDIDANGDPIPTSRREFITGLAGAEGAVIDPVTGDFLFSTFGGGNKVIVVSGFDQTAIFCGGKANSQGCTPTITWTGTPTLSGADDFVLTCQDALNNSFGVLLWSTTPAAIPFGGGTLCLSSHQFRHPAQFSGGTAGAMATDCTGTFSDFLSQSWFGLAGIASGTTVYVQYLSRDSGFGMPNNISLSDGLRFTLLP